MPFQHGTLLCLRYYLPARAAESNLNYYFAEPIPEQLANLRKLYIAPDSIASRPYVPNNQCETRLYANVDLSFDTKARDN